MPRERLILRHDSPVITLENLSFQYASHPDELLLNLTLKVDRGSKIALVGRNGCGKSTLIKIITGELGATSNEQDGGRITSGHKWRHPNVRIGHVSQYGVEELERYGHLTVLEYAEQFLKKRRASSKATESASGKGYGGSNVRQYLGAFGLGGEHAHRLIKTLSGGERMRLCFCTEMVDEPHVLVLDESSNHLDLETLDSVAAAMEKFQGSIVMVSHNQGFLRIFANTLWICDHGQVQALYSDTSGEGSLTDSTFDDLFGQYRSQVMSSGAAASRSDARRVQANLAKQAGKQSHGAKSRTALLG